MDLTAALHDLEIALPQLSLKTRPADSRRTTGDRRAHAGFLPARQPGHSGLAVRTPSHRTGKQSVSAAAIVPWIVADVVLHFRYELSPKPHQQRRGPGFRNQHAIFAESDEDRGTRIQCAHMGKRLKRAFGTGRGKGIACARAGGTSTPASRASETNAATEFI